MWLNIFVNVKPPYVTDSEINRMKKFILDYKRYSQKCPRQVLRNIQKFILEYFNIIVSENGGELDEIMHWKGISLLELCYACIRLIQAECR